MKSKFGNFNMSINSLKLVEGDPTIKQATMVVFTVDEMSGNGQIITEKVAKEAIKTLVGKRICCKYISAENNGGEDALGSHEVYQGTNREGEDVIKTNTEAIGFITNAYIEEVDGKKLVMADANIWCDDHYSDIYNLLNEWLTNGVDVHMSCEYYYSNYTVKDGIEYIDLPIVFNAHTLLNSEDRGDSLEILPAYSDAKLMSINELSAWNKAVAQLNKQNNNKESECNNMKNIFIQALNAVGISVDEKREKLISAVQSTLTGEDKYVWIPLSGFYEDSFVCEIYVDGEGYKNYQVNYTINESGEVTLDIENKVEVEAVTIYKEVNELKATNETLTSELETSKNKIDELNETIISLQTAKNEVTEGKDNKVNELEKTINSLNSQIESMKPLVDEYNAEKKKKALNEAKVAFEETFKKAGAMSIFNEQSTQDLIEKTVELDEVVVKEAKSSINALIVDYITNNAVTEPVDNDDLLAENANISINSIEKGTENNKLFQVDEKSLLTDVYGI